ncbi:MAG: glycosyltransferase family 9 protein [Pseudomonadota bacterium]
MNPRGGPAGAFRGASNVLAVRLDNLGDVLMTTPALTALAADGRRRVTLLASRAGAALAARVPAVAEVLSFDAPWVAGRAGDPRAERALIDALAARCFDAAVIFTVCTQSALPAALFCRLAGISLRLAHARENPYALLTDWVRETDVVGPGMRHEVRRQLDLLAAVGIPARDEGLVFRVDPADHERARRALAAAGGAPERPWIVVHPGSTAASRRYPAERFGLAAAQIAAQCGAQIVFSGGPDDAEACAQAQRAMDAASASPGPAAGASRPAHIALAGALDLGALGALIAGARVLVCNNSGPAHIAAAVGTPSVVLYALTNPQHTPWQAPTRVLNREVACRDCLKSVCPEGHHACLLGVPPDAVADAALAFWREAQPRGQPAPPAAPPHVSPHTLAA